MPSFPFVERDPSTLRLATAAFLGLTLIAGGPAALAESPAPAPAPGAAAVADDVPGIRLKPAFPGIKFRRPIFVGHAGDGTDRLFIVEQYGRIMVVPNDAAAREAEVFLDINEAVHKRHNEEGLLSLAFHPDYADNGRFYVYYSANDPRRGVVSEFRVSSTDPNRADPTSERVIFEIDQPWGNHNGSTILFGPDGKLYISLGDGGWAADPLGSGQDLSTLLGTIIRIDVDGTSDGKQYVIPADNPFVDRDGARDEIWAYGLRNVWRMSFDRETGDLWAGDVGQNAWEEIDLIVKGGNYGWNDREGKHPFRKKKGDESSAPPADPPIDPVVEYPRNKGLSVTGGYVYRGKQHSSLDGIYFYADYVTGRIWGLRYAGGELRANDEVFTSSPPKYISSFGEDEAGEVYVCTFDKLDGRGATGRIWRIEPK